MSTELKTSLLVNRQVPEFVRDEYPKFVAFLEAYYEFLETQQGTNKNDLITEAKKLRTIQDVDQSIDDFEINFYNTYASLIPVDVQADKALLFKHLLPLYKTKGSENSFKLLFQLVFGEDVDVILPKNNVLKSSASKWSIDNKLRINTDVSSVYDGDGVLKTFDLAQEVGPDDVEVYLNGVLEEEGVDFFINKEFLKLNFITAPPTGSIVTVKYNNFDYTLLNNRKATGLSSGAFAIIENANKRIISDTLNLGLPIELFVNKGTLKGNFLNGEVVKIPLFNKNDVLVDVRASTFSIVKRINVVTGGLNYVVGDRVTVYGGNASVNATATVDSIFKGLVEKVSVHDGGAVFTNSSPILVSGNGSSYFLTAVVDGVDFSGANASNVFVISTDIIGSFNGSVHAANTRIDAADYGFVNANIPAGENAATRVIDALSFDTLSVGPITNVKVVLTSAPTTVTPTLDAFGALYGPANAVRTVKSLGTIGRFKVNDGGTGYKIGDEISFGPNPPGTYGRGAAAIVGNVSSGGVVTRIDLANTRISGTANVTSGTTTVAGSDTFFNLELKVGDTIDINGESRIVQTITDATTMSVNSNFNKNHVNQKIGVFNYFPKGGHSYVQNNFPSVSVSSNTGVGANIQISALASDGEQLQAGGAGQPGAILSIKIVDPGSGYEYIPAVSIESATGSGGAASAEIERSYISSEGRWTTSDSLISSTERKLQGKEYYNDFSYVISSRTEFYKYKKILKELLHPVGFVNYANYKKTSIIERDDIRVTRMDIRQDEQFLTLAGRVNVGNGSIVVTGMNTKFNTAASLGILQVGSQISVNGEIRTINSIVSNTTLLTSGNVNRINIANAGAGYSNGTLVFSNGGGTLTSISINSKGSGYSNGIILFLGADEAVAAVANAEVYPSNGALRTVTLTKGGLYSTKPIAVPFEDPHLVFYSNTITITNPGAGYSNGFLTFNSGGPTRSANAIVEVFPANGGIRTITVVDSGLYEANATVTPNTSPNNVIYTVNVTANNLGHSNGSIVFNDVGVNTVTANANSIAVNSFIVFGNVIDTLGTSNIVSANARVYVNTQGYIENVTVSANGTYFTTPTMSNVYTSLVYAENNNPISSGSYTNAVFSIATIRYSRQPAKIAVETFSSNGNIRKITIQDPGLYANGQNLVAIVNNSPLSISSIAANSATYYGRCHSNGYIIFTGGDPVINANASVTVDSNGVVDSITINNAGLYRSRPNVAVDSKAVSITEVYPNIGGSGYVDGYIIFNYGKPLVNTTGVALTNANVSVVVNAGGSIVRTVINNIGLYANGANIVIAGILDPVTGLPQTPTTVANLAIAYNSNTSNAANLIATATANALYTANVSFVANSNSVTNATFTVAGVANSQTIAVIDVGFIDTNTAAAGTVEVYPSNGVIRKVTITSNGNYYYPPTITPNSVGTTSAVLTANVGAFNQTANAQTAIITQTASGLMAENYFEITTEGGDILTTETVQPLG